MRSDPFEFDIQGTHRFIEHVNDTKVPASELVTKKQTTEVVPHEEQSANEKIAKVEATIEQVIEVGGEALQDIHALSRAAEHPRAYEVMAAMMKTIVDASKTLYDIQRDKLGKLPPGAKVEDNRTQNVNLQLSVNDLNKLLKEKDK